MNYFNFLSQRIGQMSTADICQICFKEETPVATTPDAIVVSSDLFGIEGLLKTLSPIIQTFPETPVIIAGNRSRFYKRATSFLTTSLIARNFAKSTGLSRSFAFKYPENIMIKNMLSEKGWAYFNARDRFNLSILKGTKIFTVDGTNPYDSMIQTKNFLQETQMPHEHLLLVAPAHAHRNYMTAEQVFPNSEIAFMPYFWKSEDLSFNPQLILDPPQNLTLKQRFLTHMAQKILRGEVTQILNESQKGHLSMPPEIIQIYNKYLRTSLDSHENTQSDKLLTR